MSETIFTPDRVNLDTTSEQPDLDKAEWLISLGNQVMLVSVGLIVLTTVIAYTHHEMFSLATQVAAHIVMLLAAGSLKLGYVLRITGIRKAVLKLPLQPCSNEQAPGSHLSPLNAWQEFPSMQPPIATFSPR